MDKIEEPVTGSFDLHYNYLWSVVGEWVELANASPKVGADTVAWIDAHKGLLWLYENARFNVDPKNQENAEFALYNFYGVGHAIQQVVGQFSWRPDYPFKELANPRPTRYQKEKGDAS